MGPLPHVLQLNPAGELGSPLELDSHPPQGHGREPGGATPPLSLSPLECSFLGTSCLLWVSKAGSKGPRRPSGAEMQVLPRGVGPAG